MTEERAYPLQIRGDLSPDLSRWLWLVKWAARHSALDYPVLSGDSLFRCMVHRLVGNTIHGQISQGHVQLHGGGIALVVAGEVLRLHAGY